MTTLTDEKIADLLGRITPGPWTLCAHLRDARMDQSCMCGYRGVIWGPDDGIAICQPGHDVVPGEECLSPGRYDRPTEIANAEAIALVPELLADVARLLAEQAATKADKPDWEGFGRAVMDAWPEGGIDGFELQDLAEKHGLISKVEGGFNQDIHRDEFGCAEPGDEWFQLAYRP